MNHPKVTIGLILYKGEKYLPYSLPSLLDQDYQNIELLIRDQSPNSEAYDFIHKNLAHLLDQKENQKTQKRFPKSSEQSLDFFEVGLEGPDSEKSSYREEFFGKQPEEEKGVRGENRRLSPRSIHIEKGENLWHSGGHNLLIQRMTGEYYICASYDMLYPSDFVRKIVGILEKPEYQKYGSATCKLMRWEFSENLTENSSTELLQRSKSNFIDSVGIGLTTGHYFFDHGQGQEDKGQFDELKDVFGTSGALAIFRKKALADIAYTPIRSELTTPAHNRTTAEQGERSQYFDELIHYKNDIDIAYRLQWAGWPCILLPQIKVWHDRQAESEGKSGSFLLNILKSRHHKADWVKANSFFGHLVVLAKNYHGRGFSSSIKLHTGIMNFFKFCYIAVFERHLLKQYQKIKEHHAQIEAKKRAMPIKVKATAIEKLMA